MILGAFALAFLGAAALGQVRPEWRRRVVAAEWILIYALLFYEAARDIVRVWRGL